MQNSDGDFLIDNHGEVYEKTPDVFDTESVTEKKIESERTMND